MQPDEIDRLFVYDGDDLGTTYQPDATAFRVWAPTATEARLVVYPGGVAQEHPMGADRHGTWVATIDGDQHGVAYRYRVLVDGA